MIGSAVLKLMTTLASPSGSRGRLSILIYHRVLPQRDRLFPSEVDAATFNMQMAALSQYFNVLPLGEAVQRLRSQTLPARAACVTFDDGYADNHDVALPILKRHNLSATFFIATGFLDGGRMWNDTVIESVRLASTPQLDLSSINMNRHDIATGAQRRQAISMLLNALKYLPQPERDTRVEQIAAIAGAPLPNGLMMRSEQVKTLHRNGMEIGGHTISHPILTQISAATAETEIRGGKARLESLIEAPVSLFAYPNGKPGTDYGPEHGAMVEAAGFEAAVSTVWGASDSKSDRFQLPRFTPWDQKAGRFTMRLLQNCLRRKPALV